MSAIGVIVGGVSTEPTFKVNVYVAVTAGSPAVVVSVINIEMAALPDWFAFGVIFTLRVALVNAADVSKTIPEFATRLVLLLRFFSA